MLQKIEIKEAVAPLSKEQKLFNKLLKEIEYLKAAKVEVNEKFNASNKIRSEMINPLERQLLDLIMEQLKALDYAYDNFKLTKREREGLENFIEELLDYVSEIPGAGDYDVVRDIEAKMQGISREQYDAENKEMTNDMGKEFFKKMYGFDMGDDFDLSELDPNNPNEKFDKFTQAFEEHMNKENAGKKQTKRQLEKEKKENEAENVLKKSLRQLYTALVKLLHPDAEQDPELKLSKTEAMKQVTVAYESNDLKTMLELHLKHKLLEENQLAEIKSDDLKIYLKVLTKQRDELQEEIFMINMSQDNSEAPLNENRAKKVAKELKFAISQAQNHLTIFKDVNALKRFVKI